MGKGKPCDKNFEAMDTNKDGNLSKKEFAAMHDKRFKELDTDKDGKVSQEEMNAAHPMMHGRGDGLISNRFEASDTDHDGALTKEERYADALEFFGDTIPTRWQGDPKTETMRKHQAAPDKARA
jgi:Ca2+-binding EF-hand superfamily protein